MRYEAALLVALLGASAFIVKAENKSDTANHFAELERRTGGRVGIASIDAATNKRVEYHSQERFAICSTFKLLAVAAVLKRVDEKKEKLDRFVPYGEAQLLSYAPVTRAHVTEGGMTLEALCAAALEQSDNTAANLLLEAIGGPKGLTDFARSLGDDSTRLDRTEPDLNIVAQDDERDTTTPAAMAKDLQRLFTSDFLSSASRAKLEGWMQANQTGLNMIRASVPSDYRVADKTGRSGTGAVNDIAVIRLPTGGPFFVAIYLFDPDESAERRDNLVAEVAKLAIEALKK
jgi:beta-lactamase class A